MLITPDWPAPASVKAVSSTRLGGVSEGPFASLNVGLTAGDLRSIVTRNRALLRRAASMPAEPAWLQQVHGTELVELNGDDPQGVTADGSHTTRSSVVCAVMSADCLPVLLCNHAGTKVAALHGGWRGLAAGIINKGVERFAKSDRLLAWLGPAISVSAYEISAEVRDQFICKDETMATCFKPSRTGHWFADLYALARKQLASVGVTAVYGGQFCTYTQADKFFSFRRDGKTGRMVSAVWLDPDR